MSGRSDIELIENALAQVFHIPETLPRKLEENSCLIKFFESIQYSLLGGGKRFRPSLVLSVAEAYQKNKSDFLSFAAALEMLHTYSLVHDDLPSLDNDKERRGKATNHVVYGEASALLAGDSLLTEAFTLIGRAYHQKPALGLKLVILLGEAAGVRGMIGGQVLDVMTKKFSDAEEIFLMHEMKTGALIRVAIEGAALIAVESEEVPGKKEVQNLWKEFGRLLGLSFQIADDLLDYDQQGEDHKNIASLISPEKTRQQLESLSQRCLETLQKISSLQNLKVQHLIDLVQFNLSRKS